MSRFNMSVEQIIGIVKNLPDEQKRQVFRELAKEMRQKRQELMLKAEQRIRALAASRGVDWNTMSDEERLEFHEERGCL